MAYSIVVDGEFLWNGVNILVNHNCSTSALLKPLISGVKMLYRLYNVLKCNLIPFHRVGIVTFEN